MTNYLVENALHDVISSINIADGGIHPSDHASIVHMFRLLKKSGEVFDPDEIRSWLVVEKQMDPAHADRIKEIAEKIAAQ